MIDRERRGRLLVAIAHEAMADRDRPIQGRAWDDPWLGALAASFVTLRLDGELRGCIGTVDPVRALGDDVSHNARAAAYADYRFHPLEAGELARIDVEVSVLSAREALAAASEEEAIALLRPGTDGVVLEYGECRATFLPQVWGGLPDPLEFLVELRRKARLPARFWHPGLRLSRYTVEKYR